MPPKPPDFDDLSPASVAGVVIGGLSAIGMLVAYFWYRRRRRRRALAGAAKAADDPDAAAAGGGGGGEGADAEKGGVKVDVLRNLPGSDGSGAAGAVAASSSGDGSTDAKAAELPVPEGPRHEIDGVGKSAAAVRVELEGGATFGPFELPATPAHAPARDLSWRTSETTTFHYTPKPSYMVGEQPLSEKEKEVMKEREKEKAKEVRREREAREAQSATQDSLSPVSPRMNSESTLGAETLTDEEVSPLTPAPLALRNRPSLNEVVEEQAEGGDELKQVLTNSEEAEMLDSDKWKAWRRLGGGAGTG